jgi:hypothetical protein
MFVLGFIFVDLYVGLFSKDFLVAYPLLTLILVGLTPLVMLSAVAYWLDKKGIVFRV